MLHAGNSGLWKEDKKPSGKKVMWRSHLEKKVSEQELKDARAEKERKIE